MEGFFPCRKMRPLITEEYHKARLADERQQKTRKAFGYAGFGIFKTLIWCPRPESNRHDANVEGF